MASARIPRHNRRAGDPVVVPIRRGGISQARRYRPRGRTLREARSGTDPYQPALQLVAGGQDAPQNRTKPAQREQSSPSAGSAGAARRAAGPVRNRAGARPARPRRPVRTVAARRPARARRRGRLGSPMRRLRFGTVLLLVFFVVIAGRLVELQLTDAEAYAADGLRQRLREVPLPAPRGAILDRTGAVLAHSVEARYVYADPELVDDRQRAAARLSPLLGVERSKLAAKMKRSLRDNGRPVRFVYLARGVNPSTGDRVKALNLKGIGVHRDERRDVPGHDLAANVIGFTGRDGDGLTGLEARYDSVLSGRDGRRSDEIGVNGVPIPDGYHDERQARPGRSLRLTIHRDVQYEAQRTLAAHLRKVRAAFGSAVVLDVRTGEVIAMASWPSYDAAKPEDAAESELVDYSTSVVVEPGSSHKPLVIGAALEEGVIGPTATPVVAPTIRKGGKTYRDVHHHPTRKMTLPGILAYSSNVGTIQIADQLGARRLHQYQRRFGLGSATGVGVPGEATGIVQPPQRWSATSYGSIPIGLGVAVTPIQMAAAYSVIANDGVWTQPKLVAGTVAPDGKLAPAPSGTSRRVLSVATARQLRLAMEAVTTVPDATGTQAAIPGYRVAGKTGTGLRATDNKYVYGDVTSFVGMAPADAPRFVVAVFAHVPNGGGGGVAAPVFRRIMTAALQCYAVPPTGREAPQFKVYA
ncbi:MAG TPA: penicillin-binding protein 2 [Micromonosporaceae bacterium]|nr:penicillin-binding protein 2 [Micromonosporaceae bacterium]